MQHLLPLDGWCPGPLFAPPAKRPAPKNIGTRMPGVHRRSRERRQTPGWADAARTREMYALAERMTHDTGVVYSVEHVVPLAGGTVCGLHWHGNMAIATLSENLAKGTRWWPQMWEEQMEMFGGKEENHHA
jgi:hypothetical protein